MTRSWTYSLSMFIWLTFGYAIVHMVVVFFLGTMFQQTWAPTYPWEHLMVSEKGETLIYSHTGSYTGATYRQLDGTVVEPPSTRATGVSLAPTDQSEPTRWEQRISSFSDFSAAPTNWYLIAPPNVPGTAYFAGYEHRTRRLTGYLGTQGFSVQVPTRETSFQVRREPWSSFRGAVAAAQSTADGLEEVCEPGEVGSGRDTVTNASLDILWVLSKDTVFEVRLRSREVRPLIENRADFRSLKWITTTVDGRKYLKLLICTESGILIYDPATKESESLAVKPTATGDFGVFYQLIDGQRLLIQTDEWDSSSRARRASLFWFDAKGQQVRTAEANLANPRQETPFMTGVILSSIWPTPLISSGTFLLAPLISQNRTADQSYTEYLAKSFGEIQMWLLFMLVIGVLSGWACRRREQMVFGSPGWVWPVIVGACGLFGWIGYICLRPLPSRVSDGSWMPAQPAPNRPLGTEIFA